MQAYRHCETHTPGSPQPARSARARAAPIAAFLAAVSAVAGDRVQDLNRAFVAHLRGLPSERAQQAAVIVSSLETTYAGDNADGFVPDSLALLHDDFRAAVAAFDAEQYADAVTRFAPLAKSADAFLSANATYFLARSEIERGLYEEAEALLDGALGTDAKPERHTPYAPHMWFLRGFAESANLGFDKAAKSLKRVVEDFPDAPEAVLGGAKQLLLEIERRDVGTLGEVSKLMGYAAKRLEVDDAAERVRGRQDEALALLDKLIKESEEREKKQCSGGGAPKGGKRASKTPSSPAQQSKLPTGAGEVGNLHEAAPIQPGEVWGKLPPAEREKILQSLRDRFPSRYRELVEQYYRSLADEK